MRLLNPRTSLALASGFALLVLATGLLYHETRRAHRLPQLSQRSDTTGFQASDVALIGASGTPQLVEFFHPD
jgi:hypothetical protein